MKIFILFVIIAMSSECNKYDNTIAAAKLQVPPYTETGAKTFGCLVNGAPWTNFGATWRQQEITGYLDTNRVQASISFIDTLNFILDISARLTISKQGHPTRDEMMLLSVPVSGNGNSTNLVGTHKLIKSDNLFEYYDFTHNTGYDSKIRNPFTVVINKDSRVPFKRIISGTFSGMLYNNTDSVRIVGGVFDASTY